MESIEIQYLKLFRDVCKKINSSLDFSEVLKSITENTVKMLDVKACTIFLLDKKQKILKASTSYGLSKDYIGKGTIDAEKSMAACLNGESVLVEDATSDPRIQYPEKAKNEGVASILSVPMSVKGQIIGVIRIYTSKPKKFSDIENEFISGLAEIGGIGIENARMYNHLKGSYESLINDVHQHFDYGRMP